MPRATPETLWRAREVTSGVVVLGWAAFHLWEQWAAFGGRGRFVERMSATSAGSAALLVEVLFGVAPVVVWLALEVRLAMIGPEPPALAGAMAEHPELARRLGRIARVAGWALMLFLAVHLVWLWAPKLTEGSEPLRTWERLRGELGTWPLAGAHAMGLGALAIHAWAVPVRLALAFGALPTPEARRAARLCGLIVAIGLVVLYAQLAGWHAAGTGTIWPL
ncbi:MAG: hypothetical protein KF729_04225 [Sandaracinaceae bacterium]|nr:hypothetical protein [Sandaracinaceae bacterium]